MLDIVKLKSFPFDSMEVLNEESGQMEDDRVYEAERFRSYFSKFLSNGVYLDKKYGDDSMKVSLDTGLTIKVSKGSGIVNGADYELENDTLIVLNRPSTATRKDRVVVRLDNTLSVRETQLYIKEGNGTTPAELQRDDNIYEICIAEVTVKSTSNLTEADIVDTRRNEELCGIVNGLLIVNKEDFLQKEDIKIISVNTETGKGSKIPYPDGFNINNTIILSAMIAVGNHFSNYDVFGTDIAPINVELYPNYMQINATAGLNQKPSTYRIAITKI